MFSGFFGGSSSKKEEKVDIYKARMRDGVYDPSLDVFTEEEIEKFKTNPVLIKMQAIFRGVVERRKQQMKLGWGWGYRRYHPDRIVVKKNYIDEEHKVQHLKLMDEKKAFVKDIKEKLGQWKFDPDDKLKMELPKTFLMVKIETFRMFLQYEYIGDWSMKMK